MPWADGRDIERQLYDDVVADLARVAQEDPRGGIVRARISGLQVRPPTWTATGPERPFAPGRDLLDRGGVVIDVRVPSTP